MPEAIRAAVTRPRALLVIVLAATVSASCARPLPEQGWPPPELTEFVITAGDSLVATERTARTLDRLEGEITMPGRARARYVADLSGPGALRTLRTTVEATPGGAVEATTVELRSDSVIVRSSRWNDLPQGFATPAAAVYLHPSPALLEILLRRALVAGTAEISVWLVNQNTPTTARVEMVDGRTELHFAGTRIRIVHENGYIMMGEVPSLGWTFHRR
jgi:hypothetical protein